MIDRRPWGWMVKLFHVDALWVKIIYVRAGHRTSAQCHRDRWEVHVSLAGAQKVRPMQMHRLEHGLYFEVAWGYCREGDIIRISDDYGRV